MSTAFAHIPRRSGADHPTTGTTRPVATDHVAVLHVWHLHVGTIKLYIVGPGPDAWLACSEPYYVGQVGTDEERAIARRAVRILAARHRDDKEIGPAEIRQILAEAANEPAPLTPDAHVA